MSSSGEEFYNTFYNAFTSESTKRRSDMREYSKEISENLKFENMYGSQQKPLKVMKIEDYNWWKNRFEGWVKAVAPESWLKLENGYTEPVKESGELIDEKDFTEIDIKNVVADYKMITLIKQSVREDIISLLEQEKTSKSLWEALERKCNKAEPPRMKQLEEKSRALAVIDDDEGYDWSQDLPEEDAVGYAFVTNVDHDRWWKIDYARWEIEKFRESFKEAQRAKRWNDELECYTDPRGNPVVDPSKVDFEAVTNFLPSQATFNTRRLSDKEYLPDLVSKIKEVCEASLPKSRRLIEEEQKEEEEENKEEDQTEESVLKENEVLNRIKDCENENWSSLAHEEEEEVKFQTSIPRAESKGESEDKLEARGACRWKARCRSLKARKFDERGSLMKLLMIEPVMRSWCNSQRVKLMKEEKD
ncbi:uncharacterized protein LOC110882630 [Helianthus annuus]|uniref:uncharacterized protein LOC110882630 n=1 Tax=Helianthus annuus TaxID=4232 RepID=UPI000B907C44|nr:uncharacterized protein LOC110882630 [Helianthus annuus]